MTTIALPGALDSAQLAERIGKLDAKGKTPISAIVKHVNRSSCPRDAISSASSQ